MSMAPGLALQKAVYAVLSSNVALTGILGGARIYDEVPENAAFPYVTIGDAREADWSTATEDGTEHRLTLHAWSRWGGRAETKSILGALKAALHDQPLTLVDHRLVNMRFVFSDAFRDGDGRTTHGVALFRAITEPLT